MFPILLSDSYFIKSLQPSMKNKMKVITMQFFSQSGQSIIQEAVEKSQCVLKQLAMSLLKVLREDSETRLENVRELITQQKLPCLTKILSNFIKSGNRSEREDERNKVLMYETQKILKQNLEKVNRKLSEAVLYIEHIRSKLVSRESELTKKDQAIMILKKECQIWKQRSRKSNILKQFTETSSLLKNMHVTTTQYPKPEQLSINYDNPTTKQKQNIFHKTSYDPNPNPKHRKILTTTTQHKLKHRQSKRQLRQSFPIKPKHDYQQSQLTSNGFIIAQKELTVLENGKSTSAR